MKKVKVVVSYPWATVPDDEETVEVNYNLGKEEVEKILFEHVIDMIFDRGVSWDWYEE